MKTPVVSAWIPGLFLIMACLPGGLAQNDSQRTSPRTPEATPVATASPAQVTPVFPAVTTAKDPSLATPQPEKDASVLKRQPPKMRISPWTSEIVRLAESGIDASVILSFIENSGTFNLGANQIVYLNDLGLSSEIITAMLRHDQEIVSGMKPLTIASEPDRELAFDSILPVPRPDDASKLFPKPATPPIPAPQAVKPSTQEAVPPINHTVATTQFAAIQHSATDELAARQGVLSQRQAADKWDSRYRVRKPYPEEITAPIILIGESRTPNTMIVVGFPRP